MNAQKKKFIIPLLLISILTLGALFRFYNIGKDDFWIDEIIGFWVAEPHIALNETLERQRILENSPFLFNLSLKYFFKIFNYNIDISRYYVAFLSVISILLPWFIFDENKKNKKFLISIVLISFNIYLIKYSQELRAYSFLAFFIFNTITTYWVYHATFFGAIAAFLINAFLMASAFLLFHKVKNRIAAEFVYDQEEFGGMATTLGYFETIG